MTRVEWIRTDDLTGQQRFHEVIKGYGGDIAGLIEGLWATWVKEATFVNWKGVETVHDNWTITKGAMAKKVVEASKVNMMVVLDASHYVM